MFEDKDIQELKRICEEKFSHPCTDAEAEAIAHRIVRFLKASEPVPTSHRVSLSADEEEVFNLISTRYKTQGRSPSIREIAKTLGFSSSRSGYRVVQGLMKKQLISRNEDGSLAVLP